jgi:L-amino acid N-acyltransferase YncA
MVATMSVVLEPVHAGPLAEAELDWWISALVGQRFTASGAETADPAYVRRTVRATVAADGGVLDTVAVRRAGVVTAAARLFECCHPLTLTTDMRLDGLCAAGAPAAAQLLAAVPDRWPVRAELPLRGDAAPLAEVLTAAGFEPEVLTIRRSTAGLAETPGWQVRPATAADAGFVRSCLAAAVRNGLAGVTTPVDIDTWTAARFAEPFHSEAACVVAERDGRPVGHGYATMGADRYRPAPLATVHDVFVLPDAKGTGGAHAITAALACVLRDRGVSMMEGEVIMKGDPQSALRSGLAGAGWSEDRMRWVRTPAGRDR